MDDSQETEKDKCMVLNYQTQIEKSKKEKKTSNLLTVDVNIFILECL